MYSNGNSFGASAGNGLAQCVACGPEASVRWPVPAWKFGLRPSDDRGSI